MLKTDEVTKTATAEMRRATVAPGVQVAYQDAGQGSPTVVLLHGAFSSHSDYAAQVTHLARNHRVIAIDLRGHGQSDRPADGYRLRDIAADVLAVCDAAGVDRAVICGHSGMAIAALDCAALRPGLVAGVVLLDGTILFPDEVRAQALNGFVPALETDGWAQAMQGYLLARAIGPYDSPALKERVRSAIENGARQVAAPLMRDIFSSDHASELVAAPCPVMYIHGTVPTDLGRLREVRPDAIIGAVAGSGHYMSLEVPDQVNAMLDRFLDIVGR